MEGVTGSNPVSSTTFAFGEGGEGRGERREVSTGHLPAPPSRRRIAPLVLLVLSSLFLLPTRVSAAADYDVTVLVLATGEGPDQVAISYARVVNHSQVASAVKDLSRELGVIPGNLSLQEEPVSRGSRERATSAAFSAPGLVRARPRELPVLAIARALPDWRHMQVAFLVGKGFTFHGPSDSEIAGYRVRLVGEGTAYQYDVERMDRGNGAEGETSATQAEAPSRGRAREATSVWGGIRRALIGLSLAAAVAAIWILARSFRRQS